MPAFPTDAAPIRGLHAPTLLASGLCGLVFLVDLVTPPPYFTGIAYLLPLLVTLRTDRSELPLGIAIAATALTALGAWITQAGVDPVHALLDRSMTVFALWVTALVLRSKIRADQRLDRTRADADRIVERVNALMIHVDPTGVITRANARARDLLARDGDRLVGRCWPRDVVLPDQRDDEWAHLQRVLEQGTAHAAPPREIPVQGRDDRRHCLGISSTALTGPDGNREILLSGVDLTERLEAQAALRDRESMARLGELATLVAHEVNNPLGGAMGALHVLRQRLEDPPIREVLDKVIRRLQLLSASMDMLLQFSRPPELRVTRVPLRSLLQEVRSTVQEIPEFRDLEVSVETEDLCLEADEDLLGRAVLNLVLNAAQAQDGSGTVRVRAEQVNGTCNLSVADRGPGIPDTDRDAVFKPFFTTRTRGTGLGLPFVRRTAEAHGGEVRYENRARGGTVFVLTIPARQGA